MAENPFVEYEAAAGIATLTIARPEKLNALNRGVLDQLGSLIERASLDGQVRGIVITGAGAKAFVAGADITELRELTPLAALELSRSGQGIFRKIELSRKPVVAAVNGFALGGGCELALACHLRVAAEDARFGLPEVKLGLIPGYGGTVRLPRLVGQGRALELILSGAMIDAVEAHRIGLVNRVVPREALLSEARQLLQAILSNGPLAVTMALESVYRAQELPPEDGFGLESQLFALLASTEDMREGTRAFLEKRDAKFEGR